MQLRPLLVLLVSASAFADGIVEVRGAYYKERSTRVEQPMIDAAFDTAHGGLVTGHILVDSITSASAATGTAGGEFTERRYEGGLGYTQDLPEHVKVGADGRYSTESDYFSTWIDVHGEIALLSQDLRLRLLIGHSFDKITNGVAVEQGALGVPSIEHSLGVNLISLGVTQVVTPEIVASIGYDLGYLDGYQANVYRVVRGANQPVSERVPDTRTRHAVTAEARGYIAPTGTTLVLAYRLYADDWGIVAHTPEVRVVQHVVRGLELRARYRFYTQSAADFYQSIYTAAQLMDPATFVTDDEKLSGFQTHTLGGQLSFTLGTLGFHGTLGQTRIDAVVERIWQNNSFGDAWVGQLGLAVPFEY